MIRLADADYHKLVEPLRGVTINNLFARSVVEKHVNGAVYVDDRDDPKVFYIVHPYGMTLLLGDHTNKKFNAEFRNYALNLTGARNRHEWMQAFPDHWHEVLGDLFQDCLIRAEDNRIRRESGIIELNTRVNFKFQRAQYRDYISEMASEYRIVRTDEKLFAEMKGSVVPSYFWNSADDFIKKGGWLQSLLSGQTRFHRLFIIYT